MLKVGIVNFVSNNPYASIHKLCPTADYMKRLHDGKLISYPYYSNKPKNYTNESQEYNNIPYEIHRYKNYFGENKHINITGYINQSSNFYLISKFLNDGFTFFVLNVGHVMQLSSLMNEVNKFITILNKNAPNTSYAFLFRYPDTSKWCYAASSKDEIRKEILDKYPKCFEVLVHPFSYNVTYDLIYETFVDVQNVIRNYYTDESKFISFSKEEIDSLDILLNDRVLSKKSVYTINTIKAVCNSSHMNVDEFIDKISKSGLFNRFDGEVIGNYFFKNGTSYDRIIPTLINLFGETTYIKGSKTGLGRHYISNVRFRGSISDQFKKKIMMSDRLLLKILESLKLGRATLKNDKLYLRKYDYDEISSSHPLFFEKKPRFIYN